MIEEQTHCEIENIIINNGILDSENDDDISLLGLVKNTSGNNCSFLYADDKKMYCMNKKTIYGQISSRNLDNPLSGRTLIVDDDMINQMVEIELMKQLGYETDSVNQGIKAVKLHKENNYDLILMDLKMPPGIDGFETTRLIREYDHDIPIIAVSANPIKKDKSRCLEVGMNDFVSKPVVANNLYNVVLRHMKSKTNSH